MPTSFAHSPNNLPLGTTLTLIYGPVPSGSTAVVYAGTFTNVDDTSKAQHTVKLVRYDGTNYQVHLNHIPIPYGSTSKCPKLTLLPGESLYGLADTANTVQAALEVMVRS